MKLKLLYEYGLNPDKRAELHKNIAKTYRSDKENWVISVVRAHLLRGETVLREVIETGAVSMDDVIEAIKDKRCIAAKSQDIGHTYIKNVIGNAIRSEFETLNDKFSTTVNDARRVFGLPEVRRKSKK